MSLLSVFISSFCFRKIRAFILRLAKILFQLLKKTTDFASVKNDIIICLANMFTPQIL